ncbi:MAG: hypothetical protein C4518_07255 [Desulfobacteraceae bacterium]|nr:MAG: hypothetical protein C4518_07255 [Desulfobacteraceae bacterium]
MKPFSKPFNHAMDRLFGRLAAVYQSKAADTEPADSRWRQNVMRSVRQIGVIETNSPEGLACISWRLAPVAVVLMVLMTLWVARIDSALEFQIASIVVSEPMQPYEYDPF